MNDTSENMQTSILAGVRDNLLKPMANEIEQSQKNGYREIQKAIIELADSFNTRAAALEQKIAELEAKLNTSENERKEMLKQVKWNE